MNKNINCVPAPVEVPAKLIQSRNDLSFTMRDDGGRLNNWEVPHDKTAYWHEGVEIGLKHFSEVAELAKVSEYETFLAIDFAISCSPGWRPYGWGIECGFSQALVAAAIVGLRALRAGAAPYDHYLEGKRLEAEEDKDS